MPSFEAQVDEQTRAIEEKMRRVVVNSIQDLIEMMQSSARGKSVGGAVIEGRIPVASGDLINSLESRLNGGGGMRGEASYTAVVAGLQLGDVADFGWTMAYARRINYGFTGTDALGRTYNQEGWHFVTAHLPKWQSIVDKNKALYG